MTTMGGPVPRGLRRAVTVSAVLHVLVFSGAAAVGSFRPGTPRPPQTMLVTKLVRLGKERPQDLLPRKATSPPPSPPVAVAPGPSDAPAPSAQERVNQLAQVSKALERLRREEPAEPEGRRDGVEYGEVSDLARAVEGNRFATEIHRCLKASYAIEGVGSRAVRGRSAVVLIRIDVDGRFIDSRIERGSGLAAFDRAVERAVKLCGKVGPPPPALRAQVREDGFEVEFQP